MKNQLVLKCFSIHINERTWWLVKRIIKFMYEIFDIFDWTKTNCFIFSSLTKKTAGHRWHIFRIIILLKVLFRRMKAFFQKIPIFSKFWEFFQNQNSSHSCKKTSIQAEKKTILWNNIIWCPFYSEFAIFTEYKKIKFFFRKTSLFSEKNPISYVLRNINNTVVFCDKFAIIWW